MAQAKTAAVEAPESWGVTRTPHVEIQEGVPSPGRVTIVAWSDGALQSRTFEVSLTAFVRACNAFADRLTEQREARASKNSSKTDGETA